MTEENFMSCIWFTLKFILIFELCLSLQVRGDRPPDEGSQLVQHQEDGTDPTGSVAGGAPSLVPYTPRHGKIISIFSLPFVILGGS